MSPDYKDQLNRLQKEAPTIEVVYEALKQPQIDEKVVWAYYYPLSLGKAYWFFGGEQNEEIANQAAFDLVEHLVGNALPKYNLAVAKLTPFFDRVAQNFFIDYRRGVERTPPIFYGHLEGVENDTNPFNEEYPYDGIEPDFVPLLVEEEEGQARANRIRDDLFPAERRVLDLLIEEYTYPEIRAELGISEGALKQSITRIRSTLNAG